MKLEQPGVNPFEPRESRNSAQERRRLVIQPWPSLRPQAAELPSGLDVSHSSNFDSLCQSTHREKSSINGIHLTERSSLVRDLSHPPLHLTFSTSGEMEGVMVCEPVAFEMNAACFGMPKFRGKPEQPGVNPFQPSENSQTALSWSSSSNLSSGWMLTLSSSFSRVAGGSHSKSSTEEVTPELLDVVHTHTHRTKWHTHCHVAASETRHWLNCKPS